MLRGVYFPPFLFCSSSCGILAAVGAGSPAEAEVPKGASVEGQSAHEAGALGRGNEGTRAQTRTRARYVDRSL